MSIRQGGADRVVGAPLAFRLSLACRRLRRKLQSFALPLVSVRHSNNRCIIVNWSGPCCDDEKVVLRSCGDFDTIPVMKRLLGLEPGGG